MWIEEQAPAPSPAPASRRRRTRRSCWRPEPRAAAWPAVFSAKMLPKPPNWIGIDDHGDEGREVDQDILDDGDRGRRAQAARIGEGRKDDEGDDQRQIGREAGAGDAHRADDDLQADQLQRDVRHGRDNAGDRDGQRQPAIAIAATHEIRRRDVAVLVADVPEPRKHQEQDRIDQNRVGHREERDGAGSERKRRNGDERVGRVDVAADQEPGDQRAEAPAAEAPFVQLVEIALAPMRGGKAQPGDERRTAARK